ncbi:hypothetical protein BDA96_10G291200 [Sorghum bicolor]|uniref:Knottin scorpion toxin-like domain-containing protein n=2 Tax=Sorghum bicolor TaxID=4558 RepID=A0A921Q7D7_SORBI|nr:hypothetical protein BDA96_10G291200 [Sorghum bicolor]OQU76863.1 hypothetical protein SORBI_3010G225125 [Sorghum bicolor]
MAPSQMNLSVVFLVVVLLPVIMAASESASVGKYHCGDKHLSSNYKGICIGLIHDAACNRVCADESSDNSGGICDFLQCWCITKCTSETEVVASAPIQQ